MQLKRTPSNNVSKDAKFECDLLKTNKNIVLQSCQIQVHALYDTKVSKILQLCG